jgi:hypothetical protein
VRGEAARELLDQHAGRMTAEQVLELGRLVSTDLVRGQEKHRRFAPAFVGATIQRIAERVDEFNPWAARLWGRNEEDALDADDQLLKDRSALFGAGRSLPSLFMYLRDAERFAVWVDGTERGPRALTDKGERRQDGADAYRRFCAAAHRFRERYEVAPEELDAVATRRMGAHERGAPVTRRGVETPPTLAWLPFCVARSVGRMADLTRASGTGKMRFRG